MRINNVPVYNCVRFRVDFSFLGSFVFHFHSEVCSIFFIFDVCGCSVASFFMCKCSVSRVVYVYMCVRVFVCMCVFFCCSYIFTIRFFFFLRSGFYPLCIFTRFFFFIFTFCIAREIGAAISLTLYTQRERKDGREKWMGGRIEKKKASIRRGKPVVREPLRTY